MSGFVKRAIVFRRDAGVFLLVRTCVSRLTGTVVIVDQIDAGGAMLALSHTIVDVLIAVFSSPSDPAFAPVVADQVHTGHGVDARGRGAEALVGV